MKQLPGVTDAKVDYNAKQVKVSHKADADLLKSEMNLVDRFDLTKKE